MTSDLSKDKRSIIRLDRHSSDSWQLRIEDDKLITKNITNISPTGMSFKAPLWSEFREGQRLRLNLSLSKDESFDCEGEIVWAKKIEDAPGAMQQFGVQFMRLPAKIDGAIMKAINDDALRDRRVAFDKRGRLSTDKLKPEMTARSLIASIAGVFVIAALAAALLTAIYLHQINHPEESIAYKFNRAFLNRSISSH